ncbi:MAG: acyl-CoA thioesterase [Elainellaceae cyanobacterium]
MQPQLSDNQTGHAIQSVRATAGPAWFDYPIRVQPHHTDYGGIAWHGSYVAWMEEARVEYLRSLGMDFANLVALGCDLPVVDLSIRYHRSLPLGATAIVRTRMQNIDGVRLNWNYKIQPLDSDLDHSDLGREAGAAGVYASAQVSLVAVDREKGKIMRQLPPEIKRVLMQLVGDVSS